MASAARRIPSGHDPKVVGLSNPIRVFEVASLIIVRCDPIALDRKSALVSQSAFRLVDVPGVAPHSSPQHQKARLAANVEDEPSVAVLCASMFDTVKGERSA